MKISAAGARNKAYCGFMFDKSLKLAEKRTNEGGCLWGIGRNSAGFGSHRGSVMAGLRHQLIVSNEISNRLAAGQPGSLLAV